MSNSAMDPSRLRSIVQFLQAAEQLKNTLRSATTSKGRSESAAEHSWRLCVMVLLFSDELRGLDQHKLLKLCIVHDLGEAISGDVPAIHQSADDNRAERERRDLMALCAPLPSDLREEVLALWDEYEAAETREAIMAKGFDKLETMLQHNIGANGPDFDYAFNLSYGAEHTARDPLLIQIRELVDEATRAQMALG